MSHLCNVYHHGSHNEALRPMQCIWILAPCFRDQRRAACSYCPLQTKVPSPLPCVCSQCRSVLAAGLRWASRTPCTLMTWSASHCRPCEKECTFYFENHACSSWLLGPEAVTAAAKGDFQSLKLGLWKWLHLNVPSAASSVSETTFGLWIFKASLSAKVLTSWFHSL